MIPFSCADGKEYLDYTERQTKTRQGDSRDSRKGKPTMWGTTGMDDDARDPIVAYKKYASPAVRPAAMLHEDAPFYLAINYTRNPSQQKHWFKSQPLGINSLSNMMKVMFTDAGIEDRSRKVTNHSARKTLVQNLKKRKVVDTDIVQITGHKSVQSLLDYDEMDDERKEEVCHIIQNYQPMGDASVNVPAASAGPSSQAVSMYTPVCSVVDLGRVNLNEGESIDIAIPQVPPRAPVVKQPKSDSVQLFPGATVTGGVINVNINMVKSPAIAPRRRAVIESDSE